MTEPYRTKLVPPHAEARRAGFLDGLEGTRRRAGEWPQGVYGHADYELGYQAGELREHLSSPDCWCGPYQDSEEPALWVHREIKP